ncbi:hypothetical protein ABVK25_006875 [Lepraria finkii]|uniref:Uncharacterized protein n=1 Tax=Lepraria finkii TaxID=1340010 RepID=A0ABR4B4Z0_9LECA
MLELGIDASVRNNLGQTPFHIAVGRRDQNSWYTNGRLEFLLGSNGNPDVNVADNKEICPIHLAATTLSEHRVRRMFNEGADSKALTIGGQSAIHIACRTRQSNTVGLPTELCISEGQSEILDEEGRTALHYACRSGRTESVKIFFGVGADPYVTDHKGKAPLDACAELPDEDYR